MNYCPSCAPRAVPNRPGQLPRKLLPGAPDTPTATAPTLSLPLCLARGSRHEHVAAAHGDRGSSIGSALLFHNCFQLLIQHLFNLPIQVSLQHKIRPLFHNTAGRPAVGTPPPQRSFIPRLAPNLVPPKPATLILATKI